VRSRPYAAWQRFWFTPASAQTLCLVRVAFGASVLVWGLFLLRDLPAFYFDARILPDASYRPTRLGLLRFWHSDLAVVLVYLATMVGALATMLGWRLRIAVPLVWLGIMSLNLDAPAVDNAGDQLLRIWAMYLALYAVLTPSRLWSALPWSGAAAAPAPTWVLRIFQVQLTVIYVATIIEKLPGDSWREGTAVYYAFGLEDFARFPVPDVLAESLVVSNLLTWVTIGLELSLPFLLWTRRTRRFAIVAGVGLHVAFDYALRVGFFLPAMVLGYLAFLRPDEVAAMARPVRALLRRGRAEPEVEAATDGVGGPLGRRAAADHEANAEEHDAHQDRQGKRTHLVVAAAEQPARGQRHRAGDHEQVGDRHPGPTGRDIADAHDAGDARDEDHKRPTR
jgi:hypothetical protein